MQETVAEAQVRDAGGLDQPGEQERGEMSRFESHLGDRIDCMW